MQACLVRLLEELRAIPKDWRGAHREWLAQIAEWQQKYPLQYTQEPDGELMPQFVCEQIYAVTKGDAIITTEVGQHQMWAAQYYHCTQPRQFITSGGLGPGPVSRQLLGHNWPFPTRSSLISLGMAASR